MLADSLPAIKRKRFSVADPMDAKLITEKLAAARLNYGREICVFETTPVTVSQSSNDASDGEEPDDLEFTAEDYYRILATKKKEDKYLKTKKIRDAEAAASRSRITKAVVRVRFPDNHTLEATFHPSETLQSLVDLLVKVVARPDLPYYIYTTPPKKQIRDLSQDLYSAGFAPGAIVYFSYDLPKGVEIPQGPYLKEDVMSLKDLELVPMQKSDPDQPAPEPVVAAVPSSSQKPASEKKTAKPKWFKM